MLEIYNKNIVKVQISLTNQWMYNHAKLAQLWKEYLRKPQTEEMMVPMVSIEDLWEDVIFELRMGTVGLEDWAETTL